MGSAHSSSSCSITPNLSTKHFYFPQSPIAPSNPRPIHNPITNSIKFTSSSLRCCSQVGEFQTQAKYFKNMADIHAIDQELQNKMVYDALVWCSLHGLVVGDRSNKVVQGRSEAKPSETQGVSTSSSRRMEKQGQGGGWW